MKELFLLLVILSQPVIAEAPKDIRCCVDEIKRNPDGSIYRSQKVLRDFKKLYPCPSTGKSSGACPGWAMDHIIPLSEYGFDVIHNLQWLPNETKSCAMDICKDRFERIIYKYRYSH